MKYKMKIIGITLLMILPFLNALAATRCKFSIVCDEFTTNKNGLCNTHTCHSFGCNRSVKVFLFDKQKFVAEYCDRHVCGRVCPTHKNPSYLDAMFKESAINGNFISVKYCAAERLAGSKYCKDHTCMIRNCKAPVFESWIRGTGMTQFRTSPGVSLFTIKTFDKWDIRKLDCCIAHSNVEKTEKNTKTEFLTEGDVKKLKSSDND